MNSDSRYMGKALDELDFINGLNLKNSEITQCLTERMLL